MHPNVALMQRLYTGLNQHDHRVMVDCYHPAATFRDIAFDLRGRDQIGAMWRMICTSDISATFDVVRADDNSGLATLVDEYTFSDTGRRVRNEIESRFRFQDGLIIDHRDSCDARAWAAAAVGGVGGWLAGRFRFLRAWKARRKLRPFLNP
ncbi:MAG: nuclear transport factor 2 family protein [bacterium]